MILFLREFSPTILDLSTNYPSLFLLQALTPIVLVVVSATLVANTIKVLPPFIPMPAKKILHGTGEVAPRCP